MAMEAVGSAFATAHETAGGADPGEPAPVDDGMEAGQDDGEAAEELVVRTELDEEVAGQGADDRTPPTGEPQLRFDADELRRLGESRGIG
jgi:hypothetical protein